MADRGAQEASIGFLKRLGDKWCAAPDVLAEAAICCWTLPSSLPATPRISRPTQLGARLGPRLAAGAADSRPPTVEAGGRTVDRKYAESLLRYVRSARWRANFAARFVEGPSEKAYSG